jgi:hypothetical protein
MKTIICSMMILCFSTAAMGNCLETYDKEIAKKLKVKKITNIVGWTTGASAGVGVGIAASIVPIAQYGVLGVLIGAGPGLLAAIPFAGAAITVSLMNNKRTKNLVNAREAIRVAQGDSRGDAAPLYWLLKKINRRNKSISMDALKAEINHLNDSSALCDKSIKSYTMGIKAIKKYLIKTL